MHLWVSLTWSPLHSCLMDGGIIVAAAMSQTSSSSDSSSHVWLGTRDPRGSLLRWSLASIQKATTTERHFLSISPCPLLQNKQTNKKATRPAGSNPIKNGGLTCLPAWHDMAWHNFRIHHHVKRSTTLPANHVIRSSVCSSRLGFLAMMNWGAPALLLQGCVA